MERKKSVIKHVLQRILLSGICITLLLCSFVLPASAANIDYNDLISNIVVDGDNDLVSIRVPDQYLLTQIVDGITGEVLVTSEGGSASYSMSAEYPYTIIFYAFQNGSDHLLLDNIPDGTVCDFYFHASDTGNHYTASSFYSDWYYFTSDGRYLRMDRAEHGVSMYINSTFSFSHTISKVSNAASGSLNFNFYHVKPDISGHFFMSLTSLQLTFTISSLYRLQQETGKINLILNEVEKQLADQGKTLDEVLDAQQTMNNKLDGLLGSITDGFSSLEDKLQNLFSDLGKPLEEILDAQQTTNNKLDSLLVSITEGFSSLGDKFQDSFAGGSVGDDVIGSAGDFRDQLGQVEDFQSGVESDLEAGFDEVLDFSGLASLAPAFAFIGTYVNKIWYDMDGLMIVFVLAFGIGTFLQLAQHTPRVPVLRSQDQPSRSGGGRNSNWYNPVTGRVVDGNLDRGQSRANRSS